MNDDSVLDQGTKKTCYDASNKVLCHAYAIAKSGGLKLFVHTIDGTRLHDDGFYNEFDCKRINAIVVHGIVKKTWIG